MDGPGDYTGAARNNKNAVRLSNWNCAPVEPAALGTLVCDQTCRAASLLPLNRAEFPKMFALSSFLRYQGRPAKSDGRKQSWEQSAVLPAIIRGKRASTSTRPAG